jgi:hypothetical protein
LEENVKDIRALHLAVGAAAATLASAAWGASCHAGGFVPARQLRLPLPASCLLLACFLPSAAGLLLLMELTI